MREVIEGSVELNTKIRQSVEYQKYINTKKRLYDNMELKARLDEFRARNYQIQTMEGVNPFDEMSNLVKEYDELLHNSIVSDFLAAEQQICKLMQKVFESISKGLEFDFSDGRE